MVYLLTLALRRTRRTLKFGGYCCRNGTAVSLFYESVVSFLIIFIRFSSLLLQVLFTHLPAAVSLYDIGRIVLKLRSFILKTKFIFIIYLLYYAYYTWREIAPLCVNPNRLVARRSSDSALSRLISVVYAARASRREPAFCFARVSVFPSPTAGLYPLSQRSTRTYVHSASGIRGGQSCQTRRQARVSHRGFAG